MLTDQEVKKIRLSIKQDLKGFATKKDLEKFATKRDLEVAISDSRDRMLSVLASKREVAGLRKGLEELKEIVQTVIIENDVIAKSIGEFKLEYAAISTQLSRHERWIKQLLADRVGLELALD